MVHPIFVEIESLRLDTVAGRAFGEHADVAARAEAAPFGMVDHHGDDCIVAAPFQKRVGDRLHHAVGQRMDGLGTIEPDAADPAVAGDANLVRRSAEHPSELQSLMRNSYAAMCLEK